MRVIVKEGMANGRLTQRNSSSACAQQLLVLQRVAEKVRGCHMHCARSSSHHSCPPFVGVCVMTQGTRWVLHHTTHLGALSWEGRIAATANQLWSVHLDTVIDTVNDSLLRPLVKHTHST